MAGVPFHAVEGYLRRMIAAGHKVAICEQMEDAALAKGVVKREVVRLMTPGTLTDDPLLDGAGRQLPRRRRVSRHARPTAIEPAWRGSSCPPARASR